MNELELVRLEKAERLPELIASLTKQAPGRASSVEKVIRGGFIRPRQSDKSIIRRAARASEVWSGREDLNLRHPAPKAGALPGCATPRRLNYNHLQLARRNLQKQVLLPC